MKKWKKPRLIILVRSSSDTHHLNVPLSCKGGGIAGDPQSAWGYCYETDGPICRQCVGNSNS